MSTTDNVMSLESVEMLAYIESLEETAVNLEMEVSVLEAENSALRRSVAAYKASATRRANANQSTNTEVDDHADDLLTLKRRIAAYKASATRRRRQTLSSNA